ncbi:hypothetical protein HDV00_009469 [Rhizophlyctis rosea]|nr:hypothetical protein HDV00_009469 [Rhizophlyctis rosea]
MTSKDDIVIWTQGVDAYAEGNIPEAVDRFKSLSHFAKPLFNLGQIHLSLNRINDALDYFTRAVVLDPFMAVAFFQRGYALFLLNQLSDAARMYAKGLEVAGLEVAEDEGGRPAAGDVERVGGVWWVQLVGDGRGQCGGGYGGRSDGGGGSDGHSVGGGGAGSRSDGGGGADGWHQMGQRKLGRLLNDNTYIDYAQLAFPFTLHRAELLYNRAICHHLLSDFTSCARDLAQAQRVVVASRSAHQIIDQAARQGVQAHQDEVELFYVTPDKVFGVSEIKKRNLNRRMTLSEKKAEIIGGVEGGDDFVGFSGERILRGEGPMGQFGRFQRSGSLPDASLSSSPRYEESDNDERPLQRHKTAPSRSPEDVLGSPPQLLRSRSITYGSRDMSHRRTGSAPSTTSPASTLSPASTESSSGPYTPATPQSLDHPETTEVIARVAEYFVKSLGLEDAKSNVSSLYSDFDPTPKVLTRSPLARTPTPLSPSAFPPAPPPTPVSLMSSPEGGSPVGEGSYSRVGSPSPTPSVSRAGSPLPRTVSLSRRKGSLSPLESSPLKNVVGGYGGGEEGVAVGGGGGDGLNRKIRIKIHHADDAILILAPPTITLADLSSRAMAKLGLSHPPRMVYRDPVISFSSLSTSLEGDVEDIADAYTGKGDMITMVEDEDLEVAVGECLRGGDGVLEVWCLGREG